LIALNLTVFGYELTLGPDLEGFIFTYGFVPAGIHAHWLSPTWLTSLFLHGGWWHILANLLYLWIFGDNVEDRMGHVRYLVFYLLCGLTANVAQYYAGPSQAVPTLGASGAIAGVLGAYFVLYPYARILTLVPIFFFIQFFQIPAVFFLLIWFVQQFLLGTYSLGTHAGGGVAWWAHVGGFAAGFALVGLFQKRSRRPTRSDFWPRRRGRFYRIR